MDGVIVDSAECHFDSWQNTFARYGVSFTRAQFPDIFGRRDDAIIRMVMGNEAPPGLVRQITREKEEYFRKIIAGKVRPLPGAVALIRSLKENGFKVSLASSTVPENIDLILNELGVRADFDALTNGLEVTESKPSPQIYLLAAEKVGAAPENCVVIEDAVMGIVGAKRGGMKAVAVTSSHGAEEFKDAHPDLIVDSLEELNVTVIEKVLAGISVKA